MFKNSKNSLLEKVFWCVLKCFVLFGLNRNLKLGSGSSVAVIGSGPVGSFFSFFLLELAERAGLNISVDIYDNKDLLNIQLI